MSLKLELWAEQVGWVASDMHRFTPGESCHSPQVWNGLRAPKRSRELDGRLLNRLDGKWCAMGQGTRSLMFGDS